MAKFHGPVFEAIGILGAASAPFVESGELGQAVLRTMARAWEGTSARLLRQAQGAPADAGLGLVVQRMAQGMGPGQSGAGVVQFVDAATGDRRVTGRYIGQAMGRDALSDPERDRAPRSPSPRRSRATASSRAPTRYCG